MSEDLKEEFPSNSRSQQRVVMGSNRSKTREIVEIPDNKKHVKKVIKGQGVRQKKTFTQNIASTFLGEDTRSVAQYILYDVLIPAAKNTIQEMISTGLEMLLFGESRASSRGGRDRDKRSKVSYGSFYRGESRNENPYDGRSRRGRYDLDEIIFKQGDEAAEVLDALLDLLEQYEQVTVNDFYELAGVDGGTWVDEKWGWKNLNKAYCTHVRGGYSIALPKPMELD